MIAQLNTQSRDEGDAGVNDVIHVIDAVILPG